MQNVSLSFGRAAAVTPNDAGGSFFFGAAPPNPNYARRLWVGGAGNVTLVTAGGDTAQYQGVLANTYLHIEFTNVNSTGTTATKMIAEY